MKIQPYSDTYTPLYGYHYHYMVVLDII